MRTRDEFLLFCNAYYSDCEINWVAIEALAGVAGAAIAVVGVWAVLKPFLAERERQRQHAEARKRVLVSSLFPLMKDAMARMNEIDDALDTLESAATSGDYISPALRNAIEDVLIPGIDEIRLFAAEMLSFDDPLILRTVEMVAILERWNNAVRHILKTNDSFDQAQRAQQFIEQTGEKAAGIRERFTLVYRAFEQAFVQ